MQMKTALLTALACRQPAVAEVRNDKTACWRRNVRADVIHPLVHESRLTRLVTRVFGSVHE
jgi:hypothetical protein